MRKLTEEERKHSKKRQKEYFRQYLKTPLGRAHNLLCTYKIEDRKRNRGECTLEGELIAVYKNSVEASKATNLGQACISQAAVGKFYSNKRKKWYYKNTYMGYRWSHTPL